MVMGSKIKYDRIGITGSTGFIGSNLTAYFKEQGIKYIPFKGTLLDVKDIEEYFKKYKINQVVHLVGAFNGTFEELIKTNLLTTQNLLEVGIKQGLKKIIYTSSGAVYGEPLHETGSKETDALKPNTLYGLSKMLTEECIEFYLREVKITAVILRFSNVYGPGQKVGVVADFLRDIKNKGEITIAGDGTQSRSFLHITDACSAIEKSLFLNQSHKLNISNPIKFSINQVANEFSKKYKFKTKYAKQNNMLKDLFLNIHKSKDIINFLPDYKDLSIR